MGLNRRGRGIGFEIGLSGEVKRFLELGMDGLDQPDIGVRVRNEFVGVED